ncbi:MAG: hypothetical protein AABN34_04360 [Acidobacteriota bacterium]
MRNLKSLTICVVIGLVIAVSAQTTQIAKPSAHEMLERSLPGNEVDYFTTTDAFHMSLGGMAGGSARVLDCDGDYFKQVWSPLNKTLRQALDTIVENDPRYRWQVVDQVINLLPATGEPVLLQTRIKEFRVENISLAMDTVSPLLKLPEVKKAMDDLDLKHGIAGFFTSPSPKPFSVKCENVTLRQALNAIARAEGRAVWDYVETHCYKQNEVIIRF